MGLRHFTVDRLAAKSGDRVVFGIEACSGADASRAADELIYAWSWRHGAFPDPEHGTPPEPWALMAVRGQSDAEVVLDGAA